MMPRMITRRRPKNEAEGLMYDLLTAEGYEVFKRGWPDFIAVRGDEVRIIEVKPRGTSKPKRDQAYVLKMLAKAGLDVMTWNPETGYHRIS